MNSHFKALLTILVILLLGAGSWIVLKNNFKEDHQNVIKMATDELQLPDYNLNLLNGQIVSNKEFKNKIVIINFWASWCAPCIEEVPSLVELIKRNKNIVVLAISGDTSIEDIFAFMKSFPDFNKPPIYQVWGQNKKLTADFGVERLPESFIFKTDGKMVKKISGTINWATPDSIEYFKELQ